VSEIASVVAAVAALTTVLYARATVRAGKAGLSEQRAATEAAQRGHREHMEERARAFDAELVLQRIVQVERISSVVVELMAAAHEEQNTSPRAESGSRIPAMFNRLVVATSALSVLGGPSIDGLDQVILKFGDSLGESPELIGACDFALRAIRLSLRYDHAFRLPFRRPNANELQAES